MKWIQISKEIGLPLKTIQNPYSLLNRLFEGGLSEISINENIPLLAYSPLGMGTLSGKYLGSETPPKGSRRDIFPGYASRFKNPLATAATQKYVDLAQKHDLNPAQMALAFVRQQTFVGSTIIAATNVNQLEQNIASQDLTLSQELFDEIHSIYTAFPDPCA